MYIVEGNIGTGKSTFLTYLGQAFKHIDVALEPLNAWHNNEAGQSLLAHFYQDPQRWAYTFETFAMACRVQEHLKDQNHSSPYRVVERSIYSGHYCFARNGFSQGFMTELEWHLYNQWFSLLAPLCQKPKGFIYLRTEPEIAYERIQKRNRNAEKNIPFSYIQDIHTHHEQFLIEKKEVLPELHDVPVLVLDCNNDFEDNVQEREHHFQSVATFLNHHYSPLNNEFHNVID